jgi:hypothetical protein
VEGPARSKKGLYHLVLIERVVTAGPGGPPTDLNSAVILPTVDEMAEMKAAAA